MVVVRFVYRVKVTTNMQEMVALGKEWEQVIQKHKGMRFLGSTTEPATVLVGEWEQADLAEYEKDMTATVTHPKFPELWPKMVKLIDSFHIEFYDVFRIGQENALVLHNTEWSLTMSKQAR